jgi:hypothetical protein
MTIALDDGSLTGKSNFSVKNKLKCYFIMTEIFTFNIAAASVTSSTNKASADVRIASHISALPPVLDLQN